MDTSCSDLELLLLPIALKPRWAAASAWLPCLLPCLSNPRKYPIMMTSFWLLLAIIMFIIRLAADAIIHQASWLHMPLFSPEVFAACAWCGRRVGGGRESWRIYHRSLQTVCCLLLLSVREIEPQHRLDHLRRAAGYRAPPNLSMIQVKAPQ